MQYTIKQLEHLRNIMALGFDDGLLDDKETNDRINFIEETDKFFLWLVKMEKLGKIKELLSSMKSE